MAIISTSPEGLRKLDEIYTGLLECQSMPCLPNGLPRYLFRGERDGYPDTLSSMDRLYHVVEADAEVYEELDQLTAFVMHQPFPHFDLQGREAAAYAQHYGLPTQIFDFTASAKVAIFFSANRPVHKDRAEAGNMAILDVAKALNAGCIVEDLRGNQFVKRAKMQEAFGVIYNGFRPDDFYSLKDLEIIERMGLIWVPFAHYSDDEKYLREINAGLDILSVDGDPFADLAQKFVDLYVSLREKFSVKAAKLLSNEVPNVGRTQDENFERWKR
jgi:hypothetical protein